MRSYRGIYAEDVKALRERTGMGMQDCKKILFGDYLRSVLRDATTLEEIKSVVGEILDDVYPRLER